MQRGPYGDVGSPEFRTTQWANIIEPAKRGESQALNDLCRAYYWPVYWYIRKQGLSPHQSEEVAHGALAEVASPRGIARFQQMGKRFRCWIKVVAKNHMLNELKKWKRWDGRFPVVCGAPHSARAKDKAEDGGGDARGELPAKAPDLAGTPHATMGEIEARELLMQEWDMLQDETLTPDQILDRCWALTIVRRAYARARAERVARSNEADLSHLEARLSDCDDGITDAMIAAQTGESLENVRIKRMRKKAELTKRALHFVSEEICRTVRDPSARADELRVLFAALAWKPKTPSR